MKNYYMLLLLALLSIIFNDCNNDTCLICTDPYESDCPLGEDCYDWPNEPPTLGDPYPVMTDDIHQAIKMQISNDQITWYDFYCDLELPAIQYDFSGKYNIGCINYDMSIENLEYVYFSIDPPGPDLAVNYEYKLWGFPQGSITLGLNYFDQKNTVFLDILENNPASLIIEYYDGYTLQGKFEGQVSLYDPYNPDSIINPYQIKNGYFTADVLRMR